MTSRPSGPHRGQEPSRSALSPPGVPTGTLRAHHRDATFAGRVIDLSTFGISFAENAAGRLAPDPLVAEADVQRVGSGHRGLASTRSVVVVMAG